MRKTVIILSVFVLVVSGCKVKTTSTSPIVESDFALKLLDFPTIKDTVSFISGKHDAQSSTADFDSAYFDSLATNSSKFLKP